MGGYKVRQVGGYKVSLSLDFRMWGFIRSNRYFLLPQMGVYKVTLFFHQEIFSQKIFSAKGHLPQMSGYKVTLFFENFSPRFEKFLQKVFLTGFFFKRIQFLCGSWGPEDARYRPDLF